MPVIAEGLFGLKIVSYAPRNREKGLPSVQGLMVLSDATTGKPLAILDAASLTSLRTGAVGALGLKYSTDPDIDEIGIIGCGNQGTWQAIFACAVRPVQKVFCYNRSAERLNGFLDGLKKYAPTVQVIQCKTVNQLLAETSVIIAATSSSIPVLPDQHEQLSGKHFISIGSFKTSMQEFPNAVYELAGHVVIDSESARHEVGDVVNPLRAGILKSEGIITLGQLIMGRRKIDICRTTAFKSVGMALYDLYVAKALRDEAILRQVGYETELGSAVNAPFDGR